MRRAGEVCLRLYFLLLLSFVFPFVYSSLSFVFPFVYSSLSFVFPFVYSSLSFVRRLGEEEKG